MTNAPVSVSKVLFVFAGTSAVLVAAVTAILGLTGVGAPRPAKVDTSDLLVASEDLPVTPFVRIRDTDSRINPYPDFFGAEGFARRKWGLRHDHYVLVQSIHKYPSEGLARAEFEAAPYGRVFDDPLLLRHARPVDLSEEDLAADSAAMGCMQDYPGFAAYCYGWAYRGWYGNYVVEITFSGDRDPYRRPSLSEQTFLDIVKAADRHIARLNVN